MLKLTLLPKIIVQKLGFLQNREISLKGKKYWTKKPNLLKNEARLAICFKKLISKQTVKFLIRHLENCKHETLLCCNMNVHNFLRLSFSSTSLVFGSNFRGAATTWLLDVLTEDFFCCCYYWRNHMCGSKWREWGRACGNIFGVWITRRFFASM